MELKFPKSGSFFFTETLLASNCCRQREECHKTFPGKIHSSKKVLNGSQIGN